MQDDKKKTLLKEITGVIERGDYVLGLKLVNEFLNRNPFDPEAIFLYGFIMLESEHPAIARMAFDQVLQINDQNASVWNNLGKSYDDLLLYEKAHHIFAKAYSIEQSLLAMENLAVNAVHRCKPDEAIRWADRALELKPDSIPAHLNKGYAHLAKFQFDPGWKEYDYGMGKCASRDLRKYMGEPTWDFSKGKRIIVYGEQGLGDQIAFMGCMNEVVADCEEVIVDTHTKLRGLIGRSFGVETYGTMMETDIAWPYNREHKIDASISISQLQKHYRDDISKFTGEPYLKVDRVRADQWAGTLKAMGPRPKIGIAWTGGMHHTDKASRSLELEDLLPLFDLDADFINLEYRDRSDEIKQFHVKHGLTVHNFPWASRSADYDDTAALVSQLDLVVTIPTSVVHLAGGLGVPCLCIVHERPHFMFGLTGDKMPYYKSVTLYRRNNDKARVLTKIVESIREMYCDYSRRARA